MSRAAGVCARVRQVLVAGRQLHKVSMKRIPRHAHIMGWAQTAEFGDAVGAARTTTNTRRR